MGIPKFYNEWFKRKGFRGVVTRSIPGKVSSLMIDMNGILHPVAQKTFRYQDFKGIKLSDDILYLEIAAEIEKSGKKEPNLNNPTIYKAHMNLFEKLLFSYLNALYNRLNPYHLIVLAVDGVVPQAKVAQQRSRRFGTGTKTTTKSGKFNPSAITPGTEFMQQVDLMIKKWVIEITKKVDEIIYSSHLVPGEGEHKIMDLIREGYVKGPYAHIIHGLDADLIMLSAVAPLNNLYLYRERDLFDYDTIVVDVVNINLLREELARINITADDFVIVSLFIGNDFLPHPPSLEDFNDNLVVLINALHQLTGPLTHDGDIIWERLYQLVKILAEKEPDLLLEESARNIKYPSRMLTSDLVISYRVGDDGTNETVLNYDQFRNAWYTNEFEYRVLPEKAELYDKVMKEEVAEEIIEEEVVEKKIEEVAEEIIEEEKIEEIMKKPTEPTKTITASNIDDMCKEYLTGLVWVYHYYTKGMAAINLNWYYPYYHTPLFSDLSLKLNIVARKVGAVLGWESNDTKPLHPIQLLLAVLPLSSRKLIPRKYHHYMTKVFPQYYPVEFKYELDGKTVEWTGIPILPFVDPKVIRQVKILPEDEYLQINPETGEEYKAIIYYHKDFNVEKRVFKVGRTFRSRTNRFKNKESVKGKLKARGQKKSAHFQKRRNYFVAGELKKKQRPKIKVMRGWGIQQS